jgi:hypothetical protein
LNKIRNYEEKLLNYKNELFALMLFYEQTKLFYPVSMLTSINFEEHYNNIKNRGNNIIKKAENILKQAKIDQSAILLNKVEFPPLEKEMMNLVNPDGIERLKLLLETYNELFPGRDKYTPLTEGDHRKIINRVMEKY